MGRQGYSDISNRHLPSPHHLIPVNQTSNTPVTNGNEKSLIGHCREMKHSVHRFPEFNPLSQERREFRLYMLCPTNHFRGLAEKCSHIHIDGAVTTSVGWPGDLNLGKIAVVKR